jgi:plastocyanin
VRVLVGISAVLVAAAISTGIITGTSPAPAKPFTKPGLGGLTKGQVPPPTSGAAAAATSGGAAAATPAPAAASGAALLAADPGGQLAFTTKTLTVTPKHGKVTIQFTNSSPIQHNLTVSSTAKLFGATPTFQGGTKTLTLTIPPGTYQFYCSVPGHRQAGMQGTLVVR